MNQCLLTLALWSCGRRVSVVQAQRQIHRALRAAVTIAEVVVRTIAERAGLAVPRRNTRIGSHGSAMRVSTGHTKAGLDCWSCRAGTYLKAVETRSVGARTVTTAGTAPVRSLDARGGFRG